MITSGRTKIAEVTTRFIDVFGGSGSVLLGNPSPPPFEVYNDFDRNLVNLFRCVLRDQGVFPKYQARRDPARADVGGLAVYVFRAEGIFGRVHAMDETGRGDLPHGVHADNALIFGIDDVQRKYAARTWRHARRERSAAHRATVRIGQLGKVQSHERGTRHDDGDQSFENGREGRQMRKKL